MRWSQIKLQHLSPELASELRWPAHSNSDTSYPLLVYSKLLVFSWVLEPVWVHTWFYVFMDKILYGHLNLFSQNGIVRTSGEQRTCSWENREDDLWRVVRKISWLLSWFTVHPVRTAAALYFSHTFQTPSAEYFPNGSGHKNPLTPWWHFQLSFLSIGFSSLTCVAQSSLAY